MFKFYWAKDEKDRAEDSRKVEAFMITEENKAEASALVAGDAIFRNQVALGRYLVKHDLGEFYIHRPELFESFYEECPTQSEGGEGKPNA